MFAAKHIPYNQTRSFSTIVTDYLSGANQLESFYAWPPSMEGLKNSIAKRKEFQGRRDVLVNVLKDQYESLEVNDKVRSNIESLLSPQSFTITTAHQPNLFTGPLYFIYKILHVIRIADMLKQHMPQYHFIPVYFMGSEDADFEELNHTYIDGKKIEWKTNQRGAVGRMKIDQDLLNLIEEMEGQLGVEPFGKEITALLRKCYSKNKTIQQATLEIVNELFGSYGLVVLIPDHDDLKELSMKVFEDDIFQNEVTRIVGQTSGKLGASYNVQAHAREINLFYLTDDFRERIEKRNNIFHVVNTDLVFTPEELKLELQNHPGRFSPNVILRGIFQETILPNVAFIGGGGELAYWMQFINLFELYKVPFPVLILRNSFLVIEKKWNEKINKLGLQAEDLFSSEHEIMNRIVQEHSGNSPSLNGNFEKAEDLFQSLLQQVETIDPTLSRHVAAIRTRSLKTLQELEKKMIRAEKRKFTEQEGQLKRLKSTLFPKNGLQERFENISFYYAKWGRSFIDELYKHSLTFEQEFTIITYSK